MKKFITLLLVLALAMSCIFALAACDQNTGKKSIAILTPNPTHQWAGSVGTFAQTKAAEINKAGKYSAVVIPAPNAELQITQLEDIAANMNYDALVLLPIDNTVGAALEKVVATGMPVVQFDRLIEAVKEDVVSSVMGDNYGIGEETAKRFLDQGLTKADQVLILAGDLSSVPEMRTNGFKQGLKDAGWTDAEITAVIKDLGSTGWQRSEGEKLFTDWLNAADSAEIAKTKFVFTHDDPIAMGIFDALTKTSISEAKKTEFMGADGDRVVLASSAGAAENYKVLAGTHADEAFNGIYDDLKDYFSVTYSPIMINDAIDVMIKHLDGEKVELEIVLPSQVVDSTNVADFTGFGG